MIITGLMFCPQVGWTDFITRSNQYPEEKESLPEIRFSLDNGLKVYLLPDYQSPLSTAVLAVRAGVVEETPETNGYLHLLEHCLLFRQNHLTRDDCLLRMIKEYGIYYNAHTEQDLMFFEVCLPKEFLDKALGLLKEVVFNFNITEEGLEKEKKIVLQELAEIERNPQKVGLAKVYELVFPESSYGLPVYGQDKVVRDSTLNKLREFHSKLFFPEKSALVIVGNFDPVMVKEKVQQHFSDLKAGNVSNSKPQSETRLLSASYQVELAMNISETYLMAGLVGPGYNQPDQIGLDLLVSILGRGLNPLLYAAFAGYPDLVSSATIHYSSHARAGLIFLSATTREDKIATVRRLLQNFFFRLSEVNYSPEDYLPGQQLSAIDFLLGGKNQIRWLSEKSLEDPINLAMALAKHLLLADESQIKNYLASINLLKSSDLRKIARKYFNQGKPVWVVIKPEKR